MLESILRPGDRLELVPLSKFRNKNEKSTENQKKTTYFSKLYDIIEGDKLKIAIPTDGTKLIVLSLKESFELCFVTEKGLYRCKATVVDRYKENNLYVAVLEPYTGMQKFQRRQHYRLSCNLDIKFWPLAEEEVRVLRDKGEAELDYEEIIKKECEKGFSLDVSGGGMRFTSSFPAQRGDYILIEFTVNLGTTPKVFRIISNIVITREIPNRPNTYEYRVRFFTISEAEREELIRYIFQEERRHRKLEKG